MPEKQTNKFRKFRKHLLCPFKKKKQLCKIYMLENPQESKSCSCSILCELSNNFLVDI